MSVLSLKCTGLWKGWSKTFADDVYIGVCPEDICFAGIPGTFLLDLENIEANHGKFLE